MQSLRAYSQGLPLRASAMTEQTSPRVARPQYSPYYTSMSIRSPVLEKGPYVRVLYSLIRMLVVGRQEGTVTDSSHRPIQLSCSRTIIVDKVDIRALLTTTGPVLILPRACFDSTIAPRRLAVR